MAYETILLERVAEDERIAILTINRPKALNALNKTVIQEMYAAVDEIAATPEIRALIITGAGEKSFVAGADITEFSSLDGVGAYNLAKTGQGLYEKIEKLPIPVVAAVGGFALGGGNELALACDCRILSANAKVGLPEVSLGVIPGYGGTQRMPRLISAGVAKEIMYSAGQIGAQRAYELGYANKVVENREDLIPETIKFVQKFLKNSSFAISLAKKAINEGLQMDLYDGINHEAALFAYTYAHPDHAEGSTAFVEKRKPAFK